MKKYILVIATIALFSAVMIFAIWKKVGGNDNRQAYVGWTLFDNKAYDTKNQWPQYGFTLNYPPHWYAGDQFDAPLYQYVEFGSAKPNPTQTLGVDVATITVMIVPGPSALVPKAMYGKDIYYFSDSDPASNPTLRPFRVNGYSGIRGQEIVNFASTDHAPAQELAVDREDVVELKHSSSPLDYYARIALHPRVGRQEQDEQLFSRLLASFHFAQ